MFKTRYFVKNKLVSTEVYYGREGTIPVIPMFGDGAFEVLERGYKTKRSAIHRMDKLENQFKKDGTYYNMSVKKLLIKDNIH